MEPERKKLDAITSRFSFASDDLLPANVRLASPPEASAAGAIGLGGAGGLCAFGRRSYRCPGNLNQCHEWRLGGLEINII